jgi:hypothetical protein
MAESQDIENNIRLDLKAILDAVPIANVITEDDERPEVAVFSKVLCVNLRGNLAGGTLPTGMYQADISLEAWSYEPDDTSGAALAARLKAMRDVILIDNILTTMNTTSTYNTYYGMLEGDSLPDQDGNYRIRGFFFSLVMKPEKV